MCNFLQDQKLPITDWILKILNKTFQIGCPYPYAVPSWKQFWNIYIRLQTYHPAGYPTANRIVIISVEAIIPVLCRDNKFKKIAKNW